MRGIAIFYVRYFNINDYCSRDPNAGDRQLRSYFPTHMRATPWLIGIVAGYYFRIYNLKEIKLNKVCSMFNAKTSTNITSIL